MTKYILYLGIIFSTQICSAGGWSFNLGYRNPPGSLLGLNFLYLWSNWAFEAGVGGVEQSKGIDPATGSETKTTSVLGALNFKYLFDGQTFRPYLQVGVGSSASITTNSGATASAGSNGGYFGGGLFLMGPPIYVYLSLNSSGGTGSFFQGGLGFNF